MFSKIKDILRNNNERVIIVENGKPSYVILTFEEYQQLLSFGKYGNMDYKKEKNYTMNNSSVNSDGEEKSAVVNEYGKRTDDEPAVFSNESFGKRDVNDIKGNGVRIEDLPF